MFVEAMAARSPARYLAPPVPTQFTPRRLDPARRGALLRDILERARHRRGERAKVLVFDLDGTLMDNRPRVAAILRELAEQWRVDHPDAASRASRATQEEIVYGFVDNLKRLGVDDPTLHEDGLAFWKERFFRDPHVRHDIAIPGAVEFVRACYEQGATLVYLTGRDLPNMALGSFASLRDLGFPIGRVGTELVTKPTFEMPDSEFKRSVAPDLARLGEVVAVFDNEAANNNLFLESHPEAVSVYLDTQHAPNPPPLDERVAVVDTFELG
jgi:hypothetical protein